MSAAPALAVERLSVEFRTRGGIVKALENVSFSIAKGETVALVGESGSGKSVTAGSAGFGGLDLLALDEGELSDLRGREISMIFQNPRAALNPIRRVGKQIADILLRHGNVTHDEAPKKAVELLRAVRIPDAERRAAAYPFELSGGMCQRILIASALACAPSLLIADEPTTGIDVTTQAVIMDLLRELAAERGMSTLLITHDLGMAADYCDRIVVMHAGHVVESAPTRTLFTHPHHPYTARLIAATPRPDSRLEDLASIGGQMPDLRAAELPSCRYSTRCERLAADCAAALPMVAADAPAAVACHHPL